MHLALAYFEALAREIDLNVQIPLSMIALTLQPPEFSAAMSSAQAAGHTCASTVAYSSLSSLEFSPPRACLDSNNSGKSYDHQRRH